MRLLYSPRLATAETGAGTRQKNVVVRTYKRWDCFGMNRRDFGNVGKVDAERRENGWSVSCGFGCICGPPGQQHNTQSVHNIHILHPSSCQPSNPHSHTDRRKAVEVASGDRLVACQALNTSTHTCAASGCFQLFLVIDCSYLHTQQKSAEAGDTHRLVRRETTTAAAKC